MMRSDMNDRTRVLRRWVCVLVVICSQVGLFTLRAAAQEPTTEPTPLPTPTQAPTWTPVPTPTTTPNPVATPTANPTANARLVDFRVDENGITKGDCVTFSWVVRGDIDLVEFDQIGDGKVALLVSDMDSRQECPEEDTTYELAVIWLDGTQTKRGIKIEVEANEGGNGSGGNEANIGTPTPAGTASFVRVTPILISSTPVDLGVNTGSQASSQDTSGVVVVTPAGALGAVQVLPETGHTSASNHERIDQAEDGYPDRPSWWALACGLAGFLTIVLVGSTLGVRTIRASEVPR